MGATQCRTCGRWIYIAKLTHAASHVQAPPPSGWVARALARQLPSKSFDGNANETTYGTEH